MKGMTGEVQPRGLTQAEQDQLPAMIRAEHKTIAHWRRRHNLCRHNVDDLLYRYIGRKTNLPPKVAEVSRALVKDGLLKR